MKFIRFTSSAAVEAHAMLSVSNVAVSNSKQTVNEDFIF